MIASSSSLGQAPESRMSLNLLIPESAYDLANALTLLNPPWFHICWDCRLVFQEGEGTVSDVGMPEE
jgi:hypothetical protein